MTAMLKISDGTTEISLKRGGGNPIWLNRWRPAIAQLKGGGAWQQSALSDGRQMVDYQWDNVIETFDLKVSDADPDLLARRVQDLRRLLIKATDYWATDWQDDPIYLITRAENETNVRYAVIHSWSTPDDEEPFGPTFRQADGRAVMDAWTLSVERGHWLENAPGTGTAVEISNSESYDGRSHGRAATTTEEVYIANKRNVANLTDVYHYDASAAVGTRWSANLMDAALGFAFLPAVPAVDDFVIFGIDTGLANSGPFCSLVFDILAAITAVTGINWEYYNSTVPSWVALFVQDNTDTAGAMTGVAFDTTGVNSVHWEQESLWIAANLAALYPAEGDAPNITGYWVRAIVTATPGFATPPTQQNRDIYSIVWPYVDIVAAQVGGDLPALATIKVYNQSEDAGLVNAWANLLVCGLRTYSRGSNFTAYLNAADEQNPTGVAAAVPGAPVTFVNNVTSPTGRAVSSAPGGATLTSMWWTFTTAVITDFYGLYHAYLRVQQVAGAIGDWEVQLAIRYPGNTTPSRWVGPKVIPQDANQWVSLDCGQMPFPPEVARPNESLSDFRIVVLAECIAGGGGTLLISDLVIIPVDEWAVAAVDPTVGAGEYTTGLSRRQTNAYLNIDSVTYPKRPFRSATYDHTSDALLLNWQGVTNGKAILQRGERQRLWFYSTLNSFTVLPASPVLDVSNSIPAFTVLASRSQRYLSMRGDR